MTRGWEYATRGWAFAVRPDDRTSPADQLRIGDAERESAAKALGDHVSAGRLTWDEYDSRLQTVYAAKTRADLTPLFRDLPALPPVPAPPARLLSRVGNQGFNPLRLLPLFVVLFVALLWAGAGGHGEGGPGAGPIVVVLLVAWFGFLRHHVRRRHHHPRRRQAMPAVASQWEPPRSR